MKRCNTGVQYTVRSVDLGANENIVFQLLDGQLIVIHSVHSEYGLILRHPNNPRLGLLLALDPECGDSLIEVCKSVVESLGDDANFLFDSRVYESLSNTSGQDIVESLFSGGHSFRSRVLQPITGNTSGTASTLVPSAPPAEAISEVLENGEEENEEECPVCMESISNTDACMRCSGSGGRHHYFHAHCLTRWIRQCRDRDRPTCPVCRQNLEFNRGRLSEFLDGNPSAPPTELLTEEERSYFETILDGLSGNRSWEGMNTTERIVYTGGLVAAAGAGFMIGYSGNLTSSYYANQVSENVGIPEEHRWAGTLGWVAGVVTRGITYLSSNAAAANEGKEQDDDDEK